MISCDAALQKRFTMQQTAPAGVINIKRRGGNCRPATTGAKGLYPRWHLFTACCTPLHSQLPPARVCLWGFDGDTLDALLSQNTLVHTPMPAALSSWGLLALQRRPRLAYVRFLPRLRPQPWTAVTPGPVEDAAMYDVGNKQLRRRGVSPPSSQ